MLPDYWFHMTVNIGDAVGFGAQRNHITTDAALALLGRWLEPWAVLPIPFHHFRTGGGRGQRRSSGISVPCGRYAGGQRRGGRRSRLHSM